MPRRTESAVADGEFTLVLEERRAVSIPLPSYARGGLVAGSSGTGKSTTVRRIAEVLCRQSVPVLVTAGSKEVECLARKPGGGADEPGGRFQRFAIIASSPVGAEVTLPVVLWDMSGQAGHPVR